MDELAQKEKEIKKLKARIKELESRPMIFPNCKEPELYPNEFTDYLTELVQFASSNAPENTRRYDICRGLVGTSLDSPMDAKQKRIAAALKDYRQMTPEIKEKLKEAHVFVEDGGARHLLSLMGDKRYCMTLPSHINSPRDARLVAARIGSIFF